MRPVRNQRVPWLYTKGVMQFLRAPALVLAFFVAGLSSPLMLFAAFGDGAPTVFNPDVFTGDSNQVRVEGSSGALSYSIPIKTPKGRNGIEPNLTLEYNSQRTEDGIIGYGWSLSLPYIERLNKHGSQSLYYDTAFFTSSLDGELVRLTSTTTPTHRARVDTGGGRVYTFASNTWVMYDKAGIKYTFGATDSGRQYDTATSSSRTYKWLLQEIRDPFGTVATFTYHTNQNEVYPNTILYSGFNGTNGLMRVSFATSTRTDVRESYKSGFKVTTAFRISQITLSIASTTVARYDLSYGTGHNGTRSLLTSVQQFGWDEFGSQLSLPAAVFTYTSSSTPFVTPTSYPLSDSSQAVIPADTNGNGRSDTNVFYTTGSATSSYVYTDQTALVTPTVPEFWAAGASQSAPVEQGVRYVDVNGDGKPDLIRGYENDHTGNTSEHIYLNTYTPVAGYGWTASTTFQGDVPPFAWFGNPGASVHTLSSGLFGELNGDGLIDYIMALAGYTGNTTYLGNGSGWTATTSPFAPLLQMPTGLPTEYGSQLVDVNSDGLDDWSYSENGKVYFKLNNGTGWNTSVSTQWTISTSTLFYSTLGGSNYAYLDRGIRFLDINGDGLVDWVRSYRTMPVSPVQIGAFSPEWGETKTVLLNTGNGWATSTAYTLPTITQGVIECACAYPFQGRYTTTELVNWNGNGQMEQDVLRHVTYPTGGTKTVLYKPSALLGTNPELPLSLLVVTEVGESNGFGSIATTTYSYSGGKLYLGGGIPDKKFGGFLVATSTSPDSIVATYFSQGNGVDGWAGEVSDGFGQINRPFRRDVLSSAGSLLQRSYYRFDTNDYLGSVFPALTREMTFDYSTSGGHRDKATQYSYASSTRDVTQVVEYGEVLGSTNGTFTDMGSDARTTLYTYVGSTTANMRLVRNKTILNYTNATTSEERYSYDLGSYGSSPTKGARTKVERWKSGGTYLSEQAAYTAYGLVASSTDPRGYVSNYTYDWMNLYVATSTNPKGHVTHQYFDYTLGKPKKVIDPNGAIVEYTLDALDRPVTEKHSEHFSPGTLVTTQSTAYTDTVGSRSVVETQYLDASVTVTTTSYLDGLDRVIQIRKEAEEANQFSIRDRAYNYRGKVLRESLPYFSTGSARSSASTNNALFTTYTYDALARPTSIATAVGTTTYAHDRWTTSMTDALSRTTEYTYDAFGRLAGVLMPALGASGGGGFAFGESALKSYAVLGEQSLAQLVFDAASTTDDISTSTETQLPSVEEAPTVIQPLPEPVPDRSLRTELVGKSPEERAETKARAIVHHTAVGKVSRASHDFDIVGVEAIPGGVQVFVRAWRKDGTQVGFGKYGTVDIERFRFYNPPILVSDEQGEIVDESTDEYGVTHRRTLREDPREALLQALEHVMSVKTQTFGPEAIQRGRVGKTTSTFYPVAGANSPVDGYLKLDPGEPGLDWSALWARTTADSTSVTDTETAIADIQGANTSGKWKRGARAGFLFNTAAIGTDGIDSATLSIAGSSKTDTGSFGASLAVALYQFSPTATNGIAVSDLDDFGTTALAPSIGYTSWATGGTYNNFTLNASGIGAINTSGVSKFGTRWTHEVSGTSPTWSTGETQVRGYFADQSGTTNDPALVIEHSVGGGAAVCTLDACYEYDVLDNLTKTTDKNGNIRTFTYDALKRRTAAQDLHDPDDLSFGTWAYTYDDVGNMTQTLDPKSQTITYTYDELNRMLTEDYTGLSGTEVVYAYDSCMYGLGRLCVATSSGAVASTTYTARGLVATSTKKIDTRTFTSATLYNRAGLPTHLTYPDGSMMRYGYNTAGQLETIEQKESGATFHNLVSDFDYAPTEKVSYKYLGNGVQTTYTYDANALYRLTNILTTASSTWSPGFAVEDSLMQYFARATEHLPTALKSALEYAAPWALEGEVEFGLGVPRDEPILETLVSTTTQPEPVVLDVVPTSKPEPALSRIGVRIKDKTQREKGTIKGEEIALATTLGRTTREHYDIEITAIEALPGGVQAFARVYTREGAQIGFGPDGTVDIERFRIFNPPVLVPDEKGKIERHVYDQARGATTTVRYREDPREALLQVLEQAVSVREYTFGPEEIVRGKVGKTTSTFYSAAGATAPMDGNVAYDAGAGGTTWAAVQGQTTGNDNISASDSFIFAGLRSAASGWRKIGRGIVGFDTAPIASDDTVSAATLSLYGWVAGGGFSENVVIDHTVPGSASTVVGADYDVTGWDSMKQSDTELVSATLNTAAYNNFALNSTGRGNIDASGYSWFGVRTDADLENTAPTHPGAVESNSLFYSADQTGTTQDPKLVVVHSATNYAPLTPNLPLVEGFMHASHIGDSTPEFSSIYRDPDVSDTATHYQIQVSTSSTFASTKWDSGQVALGTALANNTRSPDISYTGSALASSTLYYSRMKFWDVGGLAGAWATSSTFYLAPAVGTPVYVQVLQNISYTYDAVGNITHIVDNAATTLGKEVSFTYDPWSRLTEASSTMSSTTPLTTTYSYDALGNLDTLDSTAYLYTSLGYANPHAATTIGGIPQAYDRNGNLASTTHTTYSWDYRNRLTRVGTSATTTYGYDHTHERTYKATPTATTTYASPYFNLDRSTPTKHVFTPSGDLIATIYGTSTTATTTFLHTDHLGGTSIVSDVNGDVRELSDFYPYGTSRVSLNYTGSPEQRKYAGTERDLETGMDYMQHRYYRAEEGRFISQDPVYWEVGLTQDGQRILAVLPAQNSYAYANGNPVGNKDPEGRSAETFFEGVANGVAIGAIVGIAVVSAPVAIPASAAALLAVGGFSVVTYATLENYNSYTQGQISKDQFDKNAGTLLGGLLPVTGSFKFSGSEQKGLPTSPKTFIEPTNQPQLPPTSVPNGDSIRIGPKTLEYPNGYWKQTNQQGQPVDPSTGKPPADAKTTPEVRSRTHVPLPPDSNLPPGPYTP